MTGQVIAFDPPGTIGLYDGVAVVLLRFDETETANRPRDAAGVLGDLEPGADMTLPEVVDAVTGRGRLFAAGDGGVAVNGLVGVDLDSGASLVTRDLTIQAILSWDMAGQNAAGVDGTIIARGAAFSFALSVYDLATRRARVGASTLFTMPEGFVLLTVTRRWASPDLAVWRYYLGDTLLGEESVVPGIGGATIDPVHVGFGADGSEPFVGILDELLVLDRELTREEVESTWLRITRFQPLGYQLLLELHDPGFPLPNDPASDVQLETRMWGHALGYAAALAENLRRNFLPGRAYGEVLEAWEEAVGAVPAPPDDVDTRRARVVALLRQRRGSSIPGLHDALAGLVGVDVSDLEFLAFDNTQRDDFGELIRDERWEMGAPDTWGSWPGAYACYPDPPAGGYYTFDGVTRLWLTLTTAVQGDGREAHIVTRLQITVPTSNAEPGIYFGNFATGDYLLLGLRDTGGTFQIVTESFVGSVTQGLVVQATLPGNPEALWLHLYQQATPGSWTAAWSTTSAIAGYTLSPTITHPTLQNLGGYYLRSNGAMAVPTISFSDFVLRAPYGDRPFAAYVYRDAGYGGLTDVAGAHAVISAIKHAFIDGTIITSKSFLCDDDSSLCDRGPLGGF